MDTFVLRIWTPADATGATEVASGAHGTAQHVGSGRSGIFRNDAQLLRLLGELRGAAAGDSDSIAATVQRASTSVGDDIAPR